MDRADISNLDIKCASNLLKCLDQLVAVVGLETVERSHFEENCSVDNQLAENDLAKNHSMENRLMVIDLVENRLMEIHSMAIYLVGYRLKGNHFAG